MPELPEVESFKRYFDKTSLHQKIKKVRLSAPDMLFYTQEKDVLDNLEGNIFVETRRHGKFFFALLKKNGALLLHFGMTGKFLYYTPDKKSHRSFALLVEFENGNCLAFQDSRRLGMIGWVRDVDEFIQRQGYGADALKISEKDFVAVVHKRKTAIKTVLMNQRVVAGVGNEFSDEILFQARIHPESTANVLTAAQLKTIYGHMKTILKEAVKQNADRDKLRQYFFLENRRADLKCPEGCRGFTEFKTIGGRSAYFCPSCQKRYA
ncbi:Fpg/Nei family DNA glycosylase [Chryseolinea lacunae]|uniref:Fpg/Nei family DNA glycosylase n=1 Tax=Chryseolinea lacunae TaxID=2801331 RepID=A0ABS1KQU8_9BACT|nr:Fpg/Nei family DNA glycosylase [Chryseolinea lacunae]MBL0741839.1 Fpg/Nei family DNA glycosylase [Chryseolinea lacunae]